MVRARKAAATQAAGGHVEVAAVFLHGDVGGDFRCSEERVLGLIYRKVFCDAVFVRGIVIVPACFEFFQFNGVGPVTIDFVGRHVNEWRFRAGLTSGFEQVESANGVGVEVIEWYRSGAVVARLSCRVDDRIGLDLLNDCQDPVSVANVDLVMRILLDEAFKSLLVQARVALRSEEDGALIVVDAVDVPTEFGEVEADLGAYEARGTGDQ